MTTKTKRLYSRREVAAILGINVRTIHVWQKAGGATPTVTAPGYRGQQLWDRHDINRLGKAKGYTPDFGAVES